MSNILEEIKKPLTERGWECVSRTTHSGHIIREYRNHPQNELVSELTAWRAQALSDQPALIARIEELERERKEAATLIRYSIECLDAINHFTASIPSSAAIEGVRQILDKYEARLPTPPIEGSAG